MNKNKDVAYIERCDVIISWKNKLITNFKDIILSKDCPCCSQNGFNKTIDDFNDDVDVSTTDHIKIIYKLNKYEPTRGDTKYVNLIVDLIKATEISFPYSKLYVPDIYAICSIIAKSLSIDDYNIYLEDIYLRVLIYNLVIRTDEILAYTMLNSNIFFPKENVNKIKPSNVKLINIKHLVTIDIRNIIMDSLSMSLSLKIGYGDKYLSILVKKCSVDNIEEIHQDILNLISECNNSHIMTYKGDRDLDHLYTKSNNAKITRMKISRYLAPDMLIQRYSRESPLLILPVDNDEDIMTYISDGYSYIKYPKNGKWYVSLDKTKYMGLKVNRLNNKSLYKYIPTAYSRDHSIIPGTNTYNYLNDIDVNVELIYGSGSSVRPLGPYLTGCLHVTLLDILEDDDKDRYCRMGLPDTILEFIEPNKVDYSMFIICKQDGTNLSVDDIYNIWINDCIWSNILLFRCLIEYLLHVNVIVIEYISGEYVSLESHDNTYLWNPKDDPLMLIVKDRKHEYDIGYELVKDNKYYYIDKKSYLYNYFINLRLSNTSRYKEITDVKKQWINSDGKVVRYINLNDENVSCYSAPIISDYIELYKCRSMLNLDSNCKYHIYKHPIHNNSYDKVIKIGLYKYYVSEKMPRDYIPKSIEDIYNNAVIIKDMSDILGGDMLYINKHKNYYRYYLLIQ